MPIGATVPCVGGWLVPRADIVAHVAAPKVCAERIDKERAIADARVEQCSAVVELAHAGMLQLTSIFEAGQAEDTERLLDVEAPVCPWYECPGWAGVALVSGLAAGVALAQPWSDDPNWVTGATALATGGILGWLL